jgi:hypothetical protein
MNPWWSLPFAVLVILGLWCRIGAPPRLVGPLAGLLGFFGAAVGGDAGEDQGSADSRQAVSDFLGIAGVSGLLFVAWADRLAAAADVWLLVDAVATSLGLGLLGAWVLTRLGRSRAERAESARISREMTMIEVDELPPRGPVVGGGTPASD